MCGIVGFFSNKNYPERKLKNIIDLMSSSITHRGPNDEGFWIDETSGIALGHRRLSIVDLSPSGHQPMLSYSGRYVISFNGEIYNHPEIRQELKSINNNIVWKGTSDTETLLAAFENWGIQKTLNQLRGMFAIALWDNKEKKLILIRDRFGEKPLYYGFVNNSFVFASELKALKQISNFNNEINARALDHFLRLMYVPSPYSIYEGIFKLEPASMICIGKNFSFSKNYEDLKDQFNFKKWWSYNETINNSIKNRIYNKLDVINGLENCINESIRIQSRADVQLGAFLSGGIDSSTIVSLMQQQSSRPIKTFTIGFEEKEYDESRFAKNVAKHIGTDHTELIVTSSEARDVIPKLPNLYDEPFADSSQIPTYLISNLAKDSVTVALSGDAGDELFGGYNRYLWGPKIWGNIFKIPRTFRKLIGSTLTKIPPEKWDYINRFNIVNLGDKVHKVARRMKDLQNFDEMIVKPVSEWPEDTTLLKLKFNNFIKSSEIIFEDIEETESKMMFCDSQKYLPDDILCKVDRAAMSVSLETRIPFLDHKVAEFSWRIPLKMKIRNGESKWILRQLLNKHIPKNLINRPKMGFGIPVGRWIKGPLRDWSESLLDRKKLTEQGILHVDPILESWNEHLKGKNDLTGRIWAVLMFQSWLESNK